jgi:hypothetical protein
VATKRHQDLLTIFERHTVDLDQYRVRKQARVGGLINEYRLVA